MKRTNINSASTIHRRSFAFTIVELLVVIVVIGILAAITIVSYTGISQKAMVASLQSDLTNLSKQLKMFQTINGSYPTTISTDCANEPTTTIRLCLKLSSGNTITSLNGDYSVNNTTTPQTFRLTITNTNSSTISLVTDSSKPIIPTTAPLNPVADWQAIPTGDHFGNFYDSVTKTYATVSRATTKTIYDPATQHIYDVPANQLAVNSRSDGKNGFEAVIEESRTNYLTNSYGAANAINKWTSWGYSGAGAVVGTPVFSLVQGVYSNTAQRIQYTGVDGDISKITYPSYYVPVGTFVAGDSATLSFYVKGNISGCNLSVYMDAWADSTFLLNKSTAIPITNSFQKVVITMDNLPINTNKIRVVPVYITGVDTGDIFDITYDAVQLEKGSFATSYIPTTTTTITRGGDNVTASSVALNQSAGTLVAIRGNKIATTNAAIFGWLGDLNNRVALDSVSTAGRMIIRGNEATTRAVVTTNNPTGNFVQAGRWGDGKIKVYADGVNSNEGIYSTALTGMETHFHIGELGYLANYGNTSISRVLTYASALSDSDILSITNAIKD
ncbi:MAG: prepilin-type N-terminal cleavage/methylation domain-containing protein [Candidatus Saccharibacteria bacterium]